MLFICCDMLHIHTVCCNSSDIWWFMYGCNCTFFLGTSFHVARSVTGGPLEHIKGSQMLYDMTHNSSLLWSLRSYTNPHQPQTSSVSYRIRHQKKTIQLRSLGCFRHTFLSLSSSLSDPSLFFFHQLDFPLIIIVSFIEQLPPRCQCFIFVLQGRSVNTTFTLIQLQLDF